MTAPSWPAAEIVAAELPASWQARITAARHDLADAELSGTMTTRLGALAELMAAENDGRIPLAAKDTTGAASWRQYDDERQRTAASWYLAREDSPTPSDPEGLKDAAIAWRALAHIVAEQYARVTALGLVHAVSYADAYADASELVADVNRGQLVTLASDDSHPFWTAAENDQFRFVHDALGHAAHGLPFDRYGEDVAYRVHAVTMIAHPAGGQYALGALATETRGQNAALVYGPSLDGRAPGTFAKQICHRAPAWLVNVGGRA